METVGIMFILCILGVIIIKLIQQTMKQNRMIAEAIGSIDFSDKNVWPEESEIK